MKQNVEDITGTKANKSSDINKPGMHKGRRLSFSGLKGGPCWNVSCQKPSAEWFNYRDKAYYCEQCAEIKNYFDRKEGRDESCFQYACENTGCGFYHTQCALNCDAWGLYIEGAEKLTPVQCIRAQRAKKEEAPEPTQKPTRKQKGIRKI